MGEITLLTNGQVKKTIDKIEGKIYPADLYSIIHDLEEKKDSIFYIYYTDYGKTVEFNYLPQINPQGFSEHAQEKRFFAALEPIIKEGKGCIYIKLKNIDYIKDPDVYYFIPVKVR